MALKAKAYTASGNTVVYTGSAKLGGLSAANTTANPATVTVYDNTAASGVVMYAVVIPANTTLTSPVFFQSIQAGTGVTVAITGTTPNVVGSVLLD